MASQPIKTLESIQETIQKLDAAIDILTPLIGIVPDIGKEIVRVKTIRDDLQTKHAELKAIF